MFYAENVIKDREILDARSKMFETEFPNIKEETEQLMEYCRMRAGYTQRAFARLLGITKDAYNNYATKMSINSYEAVVRFAYIFGYDLQGIAYSGQRVAEIDKGVAELAMIFAGLDDKVLLQIEHLVNDSDEVTPLQKKTFCTSVEELRKEKKKLKAEYKELDAEIKNKTDEW